PIAAPVLRRAKAGKLARTVNAVALPVQAVVRVREGTRAPEAPETGLEAHKRALVGQRACAPTSNPELKIMEAGTGVVSSGRTRQTLAMSSGSSTRATAKKHAVAVQAMAVP